MKVFIIQYGPIIISALALLVSLFSFIITFRVNRLDYRLKKEELKALEEKNEIEKTCEVDCNFVNVGSNKTKLRVFNNHGVIAYNINVSIIEGLGIHIKPGILPYERLEPKDSFELQVLTHDFSSNKATLLLEWENEKGNRFNKEVISSY